MNSESIFIDVPGLRIHVSAWGDPDKPVLFLLHGMRDHSRSWDWIAQEFAADYRIYAPDLRGHGDSGWASSGAYQLPNFILDLDDVATALRADRFAIVGHSFGGAIGLRYTSIQSSRITGFAGIECVELPSLRKYEERPTPYPARLRDWIDQERHRRARKPRFYASLAEAEARMLAEYPTFTHETVVHLTKHGIIADAAGGFRWKYDNATRLRAPNDDDGADLDQMLEAITCPVLLAYGTGSWVPIPAAERLARIARLSLVEFPGDSHWLHQTSRPAFVAAIRKFLEDLPER